MREFVDAANTSNSALAKAVLAVRELGARLPPPADPTGFGTAMDEAAEIAAAIVGAGDDGDSRGSIWSAATGLAAASFSANRAAGLRWVSAPTPRLAQLVAAAQAADQAAAVASAYAAALAELASAAAAIEPLDLRRMNTAAFVAAAQLRALAPAHGVLPLPSVRPISQALANIGGPAVAPSAGEPAPDAENPRNATVGATGRPTAESKQAVQATATAAGEPPQPTYAELLEQLDALVGLETVKAEVRRQAELLRVARVRSERGLRNPQITRHLVFTGNPGTGKTTVARLVAKLYRSLGLLTKGHLVETDRTGLVGGYLGQSESKTAEVVATALGGVLFIDEAYSLAGDQYGDAAVSVLVKAIEDHRDDLVLIVAGYTDRMGEFMQMNPGLESRLRLTIEFPDYSQDELVDIFVRLCRSSDYEPTPGSQTALRELLARVPRDEGFGNARLVRNSFEAALVRQAWRLRDIADPTDAQLRELLASDIAEPTKNAAEDPRDGVELAT